MILENNKHWLKQQADVIPDLTAVISSEKTISFAELYKLSIGFAVQLKLYGIKENENVGILFNHGYEIFIAVNAIWFVGAIPVLLNPKDTQEEIDYKVVKAKINFLIHDEFSNNRLIKAEGVTNILYLRNNLEESLHSTLFTLHSSFFIRNPALILFTSGSSGKPKAVVHTFHSLYESVKATDSFSELSSKDIWLSSLPQYHIGGFMIFVRSLLSGAVCACPNSLKYEDVEYAMDKFKPTHISIVSTTLQKFLTNNVTPYKKLRIVFLGGGYLDTKLCEEAISKGWAIVKVYGSSETCSMVAALSVNDFLHYPDSAGKAIGNNKIMIKNTNSSKNLSTENSDEILVKSGSLFKEYFGDDELTKKKLVDGCYRTGDFGRIDEDGYLYIESRREDIVITGGENVSVMEVESIIKTNKKVKDAFVFGINDKAWGQRLCAAVVANELDSDEIKEYLKRKTAPYKIPKEYFFVKEIPKTELGKVNRTLLFSQLSLS